MAGRSKGLSASEDSPRLTHRRLRQVANEVNVLCWDPMLLITETLGERSGDAGTQAGDRDRTGVHAGTLDLWLPTPRSCTAASYPAASPGGRPDSIGGSPGKSLPSLAGRQQWEPYFWRAASAGMAGMLHPGLLGRQLGAGQAVVPAAGSVPQELSSCRIC